MNLTVSFLNARHRKHVIARALVCGMLLVLPSCQIPAYRPAEPGPGLPAGFQGVNGTANQAANGAAGPENSSQLGVDEFYNDPMLTRLIHQAFVGNRELKILEQDVQVAGNEILSRQGAYLPFVTFDAGVSLEKPSRYTLNGAVESELPILPNHPFPNPLYNFVYGLNFAWTPDIWGQLRTARDAAAQRYVAACERRNFFVTRLVADIAENYYNLVALDKRIETLDKTIELQEQSYKIAKAKMEAARGTELAVQRFQAEVRKNQSEKLIVKQDIIEAENRINFLVNRFPAPVERTPAAGFFDLNIHALNVGLPAQLLKNRPDVRQAERELEAAGLDVKVARARFFPTLSLSAGIGYEAFNPKYLFYPEAWFANAAGNLVTPLVNTKAIQADYLSANSRQLQSVYNYQRVILTAFTEVINRVSMAENYRRSIEIKKQQLQALEASVDSATKLFQNARAEYIEVLFAQRDLQEAKVVLIETKKQQLTAVVNAYQALGGGCPSGLKDGGAGHGSPPVPPPTLLPTAPATDVPPPPRLLPQPGPVAPVAGVFLGVQADHGMTPLSQSAAVSPVVGVSHPGVQQGAP